MGTASALDSHDFLLLGGKYLIYFLDVLVVEFLNFLFTVLLHVLWHAVLDGFLEGLDAVAASVTDAYLGSFDLFAALLDELLAALLSEGRNGDADDLAVVLGHDAEGGVDDGLLDGADGALVPGADGDGASIGSGDGRYIVEWSLGAVVINADAVEKPDVGLAGTDVTQLVIDMHDGHFHHFFGFGKVSFQILHVKNVFRRVNDWLLKIRFKDRRLFSFDQIKVKKTAFSGFFVPIYSFHLKSCLNFVAKSWKRRS